MEIIPAIDLKSGLCVRLYQGDYQKETVYSEDPVAVASRWAQDGATRLHIVDLDGALTGEQVNLEVIRAIATGVSIPLQVGGGIRTPKAAEKLLSLGVDRVVLGTAAVQDPGFVTQLCRDHGEDRVVIAIDARDGKIAVRGWTASTSLTAAELVRQMEDRGVGRFLYTDIARDGTLTQPNFDAVRELVNCSSHPLLASGGISALDHVVRLATMGLEGAILGTALYTGAITLTAALKAVASEETIV